MCQNDPLADLNSTEACLCRCLKGYLVPEQTLEDRMMPEQILVSLLNGLNDLIYFQVKMCSSLNMYFHQKQNSVFS